MKKITALLILIVLSLTLSSCGKWDQSDPDMLDEVREGHEEILQTNLDLLDETPEDMKIIFEVAFRYHMLGDYKKAKEYYDLCLQYNPDHTVVLNNLADMLEDIEEYELAAVHIKRLYELQPDSSQVIKDTVRILLAAGDSDSAQLALENYNELMKDEEGVVPEGEASIISKLYDDIFESSQGTQ